MLDEKFVTDDLSYETPVVESVKVPHAGSAEYSHILIPLSVEPHERTALALGFQLAALHEARVTLLHVMPSREEANSLHWLDGIERLYNDTPRPSQNSPTSNGHQRAEKAKQKVAAFLRQAVPSRLQNSVECQTRFSTGDVVEEIKRFADESDVDLVVLSGGTSRGWLSVLPGRVRRLSRLLKQTIALVHPQSMKTLSSADRASIWSVKSSENRNAGYGANQHE
jgi:nucleotide-binding universal stress UspA family protein